MIRQIKRHAPVAITESLNTAPHHLAGRQQRVEIVRAVATYTRGQNLRFERGCDERGALQALRSVKQCVQTRPRPGRALPMREQARVGLRLDGLNLAAQDCKRSPANPPQDFCVAPLTRIAGWTTRPNSAFQARDRVPQDASDLFRQTAGAIPNRPAASREVNGPCVRA